MKFKNLERFRTGGTTSRMTLEVPLPRTADGRVYRFSPNENAHPRHFVIGEFDKNFVASEVSRARMKILPRSSQTVCPYSGTVADDQAFTHPDDMKAALATVKHAAMADMEAELSKMIDGFNRNTSRNSLIRLEAKVEKKYRPKPRFIRRDLMRELVCEHCSRDYGVYAIALFCPDCGAPNLRLHFARETELVGAQVELADGLGDGKEELAYRLLGNAHEDVLTAFEATLKTVYLYGLTQNPQVAETSKPVKNDFQNVDSAIRRFTELGFNPFGNLGADELATLRLNIQKRHIIGHNLGVVDDKFASHAQDARIGQTVHLVGADIRTFAAICQRVVDGLDDWLAGQAVVSSGTDQANIPSALEPVHASDPLETLDTDLPLLARRVGFWIAQQCQQGRRDFVDEDALQREFSGTDNRELREAIAELEAEGLVSCTHTMAETLPHIRSLTDLYVMFDPLAHGHDPVADAADLVARVLAGEDSVGVADLHQETGWPLRRFNPAVALVISQVDERRVGSEMGCDYPCRYFHLMAEDRGALKRFAAELNQ